MRRRPAVASAPVTLAALLCVAAAGAASAQALDPERRTCLEQVLSGIGWSGTNQLYCLKPDPTRVRLDPFGRCRERRFEVTIKNICEFFVDVRWRFERERAEQRRTLGPNQAFTVDCGQLSDRCDGSVLATFQKAAN
jgi:hypothetical protein